MAIAEMEKQKEERRAEQAELIRFELQIGHDRDPGKADHDLVREVQQHEQKQEKRYSPGPLRVGWAVMVPSR